MIGGQSGLKSLLFVVVKFVLQNLVTLMEMRSHWPSGLCSPIPAGRHTGMACRA